MDNSCWDYSLIVRIPLGDHFIRYLEMLVILTVGPVSAPLKTMLDEQLIAKVVMIDLIVKIRISVQIRLAGNRLNDPLSVHDLCVWIVQRIDIHSEAKAMSISILVVQIKPLSRYSTFSVMQSNWPPL